MTSQQNHLPFDVSRCHNESCQLRNECKRFLDRMVSPSRGTHRVVSAAFTPDEDGHCDSQIPTQDAAVRDHHANLLEDNQTNG